MAVSQKQITEQVEEMAHPAFMSFVEVAEPNEILLKENLMVRSSP